MNASIKDVKAQIRDGAYAWPGGYPKFALCADGETMCLDCVHKEFKLIASAILRQNDKQWQVVAFDINWEDPDMFCANCNAKIDSAYAG